MYHFLKRVLRIFGHLSVNLAHWIRALHLHPQIPGSIPADVIVCMYVHIQKKVRIDLQGIICHFTSVDMSAAPNRNIGYLQVPGSISAKKLRIQTNKPWQIQMDLG